MFEIGDAVARKSTGQAGFIHQVRKARATMLLIHWSDGEQWLVAGIRGTGSRHPNTTASQAFNVMGTHHTAVPRGPEEATAQRYLEETQDRAARTAATG